MVSVLPESTQGRQLLLSLAITSAASVVLYVIDAIFNNGSQFYYLIWNLFLAWLPLLFAHLLMLVLKNHLWSSWSALLFTFLWLIFLPNSFYLISDFVHLFDATNTNMLFNVAMFGSFAFSGMALGCTSLGLIHRQLLIRRGDVSATMLVGLVLLVSSYAVYLGRYVRLNSWDIFTNFGAVLFNFSAQVMSPQAWHNVAGTSLGFFILIASIYLVVWRLARLARD